MSKQEENRRRVSDLLHSQVDEKDIARIVGVSLKTVYNNNKAITKWEWPSHLRKFTEIL